MGGAITVATASDQAARQQAHCHGGDLMQDVQVIQMIVSTVAVVVAAVWAVAAIKATTATLKNEINNLAKTIDRLDRVLNVLAKDHDRLETRVTKLEMSVEHIAKK